MQGIHGVLHLMAFSTCIWDPNLVISIPVDVLSPNGAGLSTGTLLTEKLGIDFSKLLWHC